MSPTAFEETPFETASELLDALRLSKREWWDYHDVPEEQDRSWVRHWYFRGQCNAECSLLPSAWRDKSNDPSKDFIGIIKSKFLHERYDFSIDHILGRKWENQAKPPARKGEEKWERTCSVVLQALAEIELIGQFLQRASDLGHRVPGIRDWMSLTENFTNKFIPRYIDGLDGDGNNDEIWTHPVLALAQHHRITTRLLDWTRNPLYAAFFAAVDSCNNPDLNKKIAVYAINDISLEDHNIKLVSVPGSEIDFLRVQEGVFTYDRKGDELYIRDGQYPGLETSMLGVFNRALQPRKLTLPQTEAPDLLRLLWLEGVTQAHLMPTLDNVSEALKTKWRLADKTN